MLSGALRESILALFAICVTTAGLDSLALDGHSSQSFRQICALAASVCALRVVVQLMK